MLSVPGLANPMQRERAHRGVRATGRNSAWQVTRLWWRKIAAAADTQHPSRLPRGSRRWLGFVSWWGSLWLTALMVVSLLCVLCLTLGDWQAALSPDGARRAAGGEPPQDTRDRIREDLAQETTMRLWGSGNPARAAQGDDAARSRTPPQVAPGEGLEEVRKIDRKSIQPQDQVGAQGGCAPSPSSPNFSLRLFEGRANAAMLLALALMGLHVFRLRAKLAHARLEIVQARRSRDTQPPVQWTVFQNGLARLRSRSPSPGTAMGGGYPDSEPGGPEVPDWRLMAADAGRGPGAPIPVWEPLPLSALCDTSPAKVPVEGRAEASPLPFGNADLRTGAASPEAEGEGTLAGARMRFGGDSPLGDPEREGHGSMHHKKSNLSDFGSPFSTPLRAREPVGSVEITSFPLSPVSGASTESRESLSP